jgi:chromosomal replication initiator protein
MQVTPEKILSVVSQHYKVSIAEMQSKSRIMQTVNARQMFFYLCRKHTHKSQQYIADYLNRDHATVLHAERKIADLLRLYPNTQKQVEKIEETLFNCSIEVKHVDLLAICISNTHSAMMLR